MNSITEPKMLSFRRLIRQTIPEIWLYQTCATLLLVGISSVLLLPIDKVAAYGGTALTTANLSDFLFSWRAPVLFVLGILLVSVYIVIEIFAHIHFSNDILNGKPARMRTEVKEALHSLTRFLNPRGLLILLYIFIAIPIGGIGFSISLTRRLYIPNFIMDVILNTPSYCILYLVVILMVFLAGFRHFFALHGILMDGLTPRESLVRSEQIMKTHWKNFIKEMLRMGFFLTITILFVDLLVSVIPGQILTHYQDEISSTLLRRFLDALYVFLGSYLNSLTVILCGSVTMIYFTILYRRYAHGEETEWPERPKKTRYLRCVFLMFLIAALIALVSFPVAFGFDYLFPSDQPVEIIAHRAGGAMAPENSPAGVKAAIDHGCFGSETDVQRTRDGFYIINHDDDFSRLAGNAHSPSELTLKQIRALQLPEGEHPATLEEMLDAADGKTTLFIELKGSSADRQMVDDVVRIVREKNAVDKVVLISLKYNVIDYAETTYPEFETGVLCFASIGNVASLNCDDLIIEEEMSNYLRILDIHLQGKKVFVWTVNDDESLHRFLSGNADAIITDQVENAQNIQKSLNQRSDLTLLTDMLSTVLN